MNFSRQMAIKIFILKSLLAEEGKTKKKERTRNAKIFGLFEDYCQQLLNNIKEVLVKVLISPIKWFIVMKDVSDGVVVTKNILKENWDRYWIFIEVRGDVTYFHSKHI
eukprot:GHVR01050891.1.p2 GENE.GHVR01050891.1~~GHVR01050891.1.p2  ORF type:complete len:108 (-),score=6.56 GHVR01050891.1:96-419(-)